MFADQPERGRAIEPELGKRGARLADEGVQLTVGRDSAFAGEGGLGRVAKDSIEEPG